MQLSVSKLAKHYGDSVVFSQVSLEVNSGEFVAIVGESGVGKSTLLNCLAGLDQWDQGTVLLDGQDLGRLGDEPLARLRREHIGFVFQAFHVLPHLDVAQNVALPLMLLGRNDPARVQAMLAAVGLDGLGARLPQQLSGGQLQRVAIARALVHSPAAGRRAHRQPGPQHRATGARHPGRPNPPTRRRAGAGDPLPSRGRARRPGAAAYGTGAFHPGLVVKASAWRTGHVGAGPSGYARVPRT